MNIYTYFSNLEKKGKTGNGTFQRTLQATGELPYMWSDVSCDCTLLLTTKSYNRYMSLYLNIGIRRRALASIVNEKQKMSTDETFEFPAKRYKTSRKKIISDSFDRDAIRRKIYSLYEMKRHVTLSSLLVR